MLISIDAGKWGTKAIVRNNDGTFDKFYARTKMEITEEVDCGSKSHIIEFEGNKYLFGEEANTINYEISKKQDQHRMANYLAVSNFIGDKLQEVNLVIGCPLNIFMNRTLREEYKEFMMENKIVKLTVNNKEKQFIINDITVLPESIGYIYQNPSKYKNALVGVIDIGGLNTNGAIYQNRKPIKSSAFTINEGGSILHNKIKKTLNSGLGLNCQDYEIPNYIKRGLRTNGASNEKGNSLIQEVIMTQVDRIIEEMKKNNWNLETLDLVFIGRGSKTLEKFIKHQLTHAIISETCEWDNAIGFYKMGEVVYG